MSRNNPGSPVGSDEYRGYRNAEDLEIASSRDVIRTATIDAAKQALRESEDALRRSEEGGRNLLESVAAGMIIVQNGHICHVNSAAEDITGYCRNELIGMPILDILHPDSQQTAWDRAVATLRGGSASTGNRFEARLVRKSGEERWSEITYAFIEYDGKPAVLGTGYDITDRKRAEEELSRSEARYRTLVEAMDDAVAVLDSGYHYVTVNAETARRLGLTRKALVGRTPWDIYPPEKAKREAEEDSYVLRTGSVVDCEDEYVDGQQIRVCHVRKVPLRTEDGSVIGLVTVSRDITERKQQEEQLSFLAAHDPLTGLPNRRSLEEALAHSISMARKDVRASLLFLDLDNFKIVNDTLGHTAGDQLLISLARMLQERMRIGDTLARMGGDEFAVLLQDISAEHAKVVAERIRVAIDEFQFTMKDHRFDLSASIGMVPIDGQQDPAQVLSVADAMMYKSKEHGGNWVTEYHPDEDHVAQLAITNRIAVRLKDAIRDSRFVLHFQPVVRLTDGSVRHFEALIRMKGEGGELTPPSAFIPVAERFGLMAAVTRWVIEDVLRTLQKTAETCVFVNLSGRCLADHALLEFIKRSMRASGVDPRRLGFEITETAVVQDLAAANRWIQELRSLGCMFALDDFGSGYTTFFRLQALSVDQIKIDGSLIRTLERDPIQRALVQAILTMGHTLGKEIVAECVESPAVALMLSELGVDYGQGYHLGKPTADLPVVRYVPGVGSGDGDGRAN